MNILKTKGTRNKDTWNVGHKWCILVILKCTGDGYIEHVSIKLRFCLFNIGDRCLFVEDLFFIWLSIRFVTTYNAQHYTIRCHRIREYETYALQRLPSLFSRYYVPTSYTSSVFLCICELREYSLIFTILHCVWVTDK